jgi:hypothetical protein
LIDLHRGYTAGGIREKAMKIVIRSFAICAVLAALAGCADSNASLNGGGSENGGSAAGRVGSIFRF